MPPGYTLVAPFTADVFGNVEPFGYVMQSATDAVLAFRGTDDFPDAIADIRYNQAPTRSSKCRVDPRRLHGRLPVGSCRGSRRRQLVARRLAALRHRPQSGRRRRDTGRARHRRQHGVQDSDRLHHRQPACRQLDFADCFDTGIVTAQTQSWRVVNMCDLVPLLPPKDIFDLLDEKTYFYQHVTNDLLVAFFKGGAIANHRLENYIEAMQQLT